MRKSVLFLILAALLLALNACALPQRLLSRTPAPAGGAVTATPAKNERAVPEAARTPQMEAAVSPAATAVLPALNGPGAEEAADYAITVTLDPEARVLQGRETLTYRNTTSAPFDEIVFHLYLNAFKSLDTLFMQESGGQLRGYAFDPESAGGIEVSDLQMQGGGALTLELLEDGTLARARLPRAVEPGESVTLQMEFTARLPRIFARTGWALDEQGDPFFLVAQWFPKPGVWQAGGWAADPFHGNAEFFADFGRYDVTITLPAGYVTAATGVQAGPAAVSGGAQTVRYRAAGVIDFAWVASPNLIEARRAAGDQELRYLYLPEHDWTAEPVLESAANAVQHFEQWFGPYPYELLTLVDVPEEGSGAGGMEYPTFVTIGAEGRPGSTAPRGWENYLEIVTVHEIAHQWWQSMVATDEGREPWLDEGFADYSTILLLTELYGPPYGEKATGGFASGFLEGRRRSFLRAPDVPMYGAAWEYRYGDYVTAAYAKPDLALMTLEAQLGRETMLELLAAYFARWQFRHPTTADFAQVAREVSGDGLEWFFDGLVYGDDTLNWSLEPVAEGSVTVAREGELELPAEVLVTLEDGSAQAFTCPAEKTRCTFRFDGPVREAQIDPERKLPIDLDWSDNWGRPEQ